MEPPSIDSSALALQLQPAGQRCHKPALRVPAKLVVLEQAPLPLRPCAFMNRHGASERVAPAIAAHVDLGIIRASGPLSLNAIIVVVAEHQFSSLFCITPGPRRML